jgi:hypothetical protein
MCCFEKDTFCPCVWNVFDILDSKNILVYDQKDLIFNTVVIMGVRTNGPIDPFAEEQDPKPYSLVVGYGSATVALAGALHAEEVN